MKEMNGMILSELVAQSESEFITSGEATHMIIDVDMGGTVPEVIVNPAVNIAAKIAYYKTAYNEDLTLKANPAIKIVGFGFTSNIRTWVF